MRTLLCCLLALPGLAGVPPTALHAASVPGGIVTGAHLHWSVILKQNAVDALLLVGAAVVNRLTE